jgi:uncharacterized OsmC-like protein
MKPLPHTYDVRLTGGPAGYAEASAAGLPALRMAPPSDFDGPGDAWSPEHLLLASVLGCFLFTLRAVARHSSVDFLGVDVTAAGIVDRRDRVTRFTEIVIRPRLTVPAGSHRDRVQAVLEKTEKACLVSASLSTPIRVEPVVEEREEQIPALATA